MNKFLSFTTISGIDDKVCIDELQIIDSDYNVEFGILFSYKRLGTNRYPSLKYIKNLDCNFKNLSLHLCGGVVEDICKNDGDINRFLDIFKQFNNFKRIQLNFSNKYIGETIDFDILENNMHKIEFDKIEFILQLVEDFSIPSWAFHNKINCSFLQDQSGGAGKLAKVWWHSFGNRFGYAGGLSPDNLENQLRWIGEKQKVAVWDNFKRDIWIDAESGLRSNDELDLDKVIKFLDISKRYEK